MLRNITTVCLWRKEMLFKKGKFLSTLFNVCTKLCVILFDTWMMMVCGAAKINQKISILPLFFHWNNGRKQKRSQTITNEKKSHLHSYSLQLNALKRGLKVTLFIYGRKRALLNKLLLKHIHSHSLSLSLCHSVAFQ